MIYKIEIKLLVMHTFQGSYEDQMKILSTINLETSLKS